MKKSWQSVTYSDVFRPVPDRLITEKSWVLSERELASFMTKFVLVSVIIYHEWIIKAPACCGMESSPYTAVQEEKKNSKRELRIEQSR